MRILDLYCGAGGAANGYQRAGFHVEGVDKDAQRHYCGDEFTQGDALAFLRSVIAYPGTFDAIHASPPCQHYAGVTAWRGDQAKHPDLIAATRDLILVTGLPYVIENVPDARPHLIDPHLICGSHVGLPVRRHRLFEVNWPLALPPAECDHKPTDMAFMHKYERAYADAMECTWMSAREGREAIPPAYTDLIGRELMAHLAYVAPDAHRLATGA